jgi:hypothetical protein
MLYREVQGIVQIGKNKVQGINHPVFDIQGIVFLRKKVQGISHFF